jgi:hypothetical protein
LLHGTLVAAPNLLLMEKLWLTPENFTHVSLQSTDYLNVQSLLLLA